MDKQIDFAELAKDLAMLDGTPPYDGPGNHCRNDAYFGRSIEQKHGRPIAELRKLVRNRK